MPSSYEIVRDVATNFMLENGVVDGDNSISAIELRSKVIRELQSNGQALNISLETYLQYFSKAANQDPQSKIISGGPRRGYWADPSDLQSTNTEADGNQDISPSSNFQNHKPKVLEKHLYSLVRSWLETKDYTSKEVANLKGGGKWGNPDIFGIRRVDLFGCIDIETVSCEVKLSDAAWEQFIFEALSHKRFCNRSWFIYRVGEERDSLPIGMEAYAEKFRIGIVEIALSDVELVKLAEGSPASEFLLNVRERIPAYYDQVPLLQKKEICERVGIEPRMTFS